MGQILSHPITVKSPENDEGNSLLYGLSCMQGWRVSMEDSHATILKLNDEVDEDVAFFGVYDGHGGDKVAIFTGANLHNIVKNTTGFKLKNYGQALKQAFIQCDFDIIDDPPTKNDESGCAATSVIITKEKIICGNAGDSRVIMSIDGLAKLLSYDHKPSNEGERARIYAAGGFVDASRVMGNLALSRAIGDLEFKKSVTLPPEDQIVTADPDIIEHEIYLPKDEFVVLACDGIWDCLSSQQVVELVRRGVFERKPLQEICNTIMDVCLAPSSLGSGIGCDNMSICIVALLQPGQNLDQWYDHMIAKINNQVGSISLPFDELSVLLYGSTIEEKLSQHSVDEDRNRNNTGFTDFQGNASTEIYEEEITNDEEPNSLNLSTLQNLWRSRGIKAENGVVYLDASSASSILSSLGVVPSGEEEEDQEMQHEEDEEEEQQDKDSKIEEVEEQS